MSADNWAICPECHDPDSTETVREDYEFILDKNGLLNIYYQGKCNNCGAEWKFEQNGIECRVKE